MESSVRQYTEKQLLVKTKHSADMAENLLDEIIPMIKPGITENEITSNVLKLFEKRGINKNWHNPYIRFGTNTLLTFKDKPQEDKILNNEDIAFIDIGPIIDDVEGDIGKTIVFGNNPLFSDLKSWSEKLFDLGINYWHRHKPTGVELYKYIREEASKANYIFNLEPAGHLIGSFPHAKWFKEGMDKYPYEIESGMWILEIQIRHPHEPYGAFYEEILL